MSTFQLERQQFYKRMDEFWHDLFGTEYALFDIKKETSQNVKRIRQATERIGHILDQTAPLLRQLDDETLLELGFPKETLNYIRLQTLPFESVIARLDLVVTDESIKLLEINADTPTFIKECFFVNGAVCEAFGLKNPNINCEKQLQKAVRDAVVMSFHSLQRSKAPNIVFTSHDEHEEDRLTTLYLEKLFGAQSQFISLSDLRLVAHPIIEDEEVICEPGLYDSQGQKIDVLYRQTYPIEHLVLDEDPVTKEKVGQLLMKLVEEKQLTIINPPSAFLLQSKAIMALIWGLHEENHSFYSKEEHEWIHQYFLPTYLDEDVFIEKKMMYVKKPAFGREGDTVEVYNESGTKVDEDRHKTYRDSLPVYQQFIKLPEMSVQTEQGTKNVHYMYGCFYINGGASAIGIRAGRQITDNESYFLPVGIVDEEEL
jgi:glutathionylspermidine synthase